MLLPHEWIAMYSEYPDCFEEVFFDPSLPAASYWSDVEGSAWFESLPFKASISHCPTTWIPLRVHGDDVPVGKNSGLLVLSLVSALAAHKGFPARLLVASLATNSITAAGIEECYRVVSWSLSVLTAGTWPNRDPWGAAWPPQSVRAQRAGQALCSRARFVTSELIGV
eukprot:9213104-Alexandrium_andersonii.AAC.1